MSSWSRLVALLLAAAILLGAQPRERRRRDGGISALGHLVVALDEAATAVASIWQVLAPPADAAGEGAEEALTDDSRERLKSLSADLSELVAIQRGEVFLKIEEYIQDPSEDTWSAVESTLQDVLVRINGVLESVADERSDFVLERTYLDLFVTLRTRSGVVRQLIDLPPPASAEEIHQLRRIQARYIELVGNLERAIAELNRYLAADRPGGGS